MNSSDLSKHLKNPIIPPAMMKALRKRYKLVLWGLAILIIPPFVWWGAGTSGDQKKMPGYAGFIGKHKVSLKEYLLVYSSLSNSLAQWYGNHPPENLLDELTWTHLLLLHEARNRGIKISDEAVRKNIAEISHFQKDGQFDPVSYRKAFGDYARDFEERIRQQLTIDKLRENISQGIAVADDEVETEYTKEYSKVQLSYAIIAIPKKETQVQNPSQIPDRKEESLPEPPPVPALNPAPAEDIQKKRDSIHRNAEQSHEEIKQKIAAGIPIADAFAQLTLPLTLTEPLSRHGIIPQLGYQPSLIESAFETPEGTLGPLIELADGFCLFWTGKKIPPDETSFQTEKETFQQRLLEKKQEENFSQWFSELKKKTPIKKTLPDLKD